MRISQTIDAMSSFGNSATVGQETGDFCWTSDSWYSFACFKNFQNSFSLQKHNLRKVSPTNHNIALTIWESRRAGLWVGGMAFLCPIEQLVRIVASNGLALWKKAVRIFQISFSIWLVAAVQVWYTLKQHLKFKFKPILPSFIYACLVCRYTREGSVRST